MLEIDTELFENSTNRNEGYLDTRIQIPTGSFEDSKLKNVYDMAGNTWEWTTEVNYHQREWKDNKLTNKEIAETEPQFGTVRGGCFTDLGTQVSLCSRHGDPVSDWTECIGRFPCCTLCKINKCYIF